MRPAASLWPNLKSSLARRLVSATSLAVCSPEHTEHLVPSMTVDCTDAPIMPFKESASHLHHRTYRTPPLFVLDLPGMLYYTYHNILLTPFRRIISEYDNTGVIRPGAAVGHMYYWRYLYTRKSEFIHGDSVILRSRANNYYHTLVDNLPRLYLLRLSALHRRRPLKLLHPPCIGKWERFFLKILCPPNVTLTPVQMPRLYRLERLIYLPFLSRLHSGYLPPDYVRFFRAATLPNRRPEAKELIYISRRKALGGRRLLNEENLWSHLRRRGFKRYCLEELPISEQIELFFDARMVVGPHGAGLTNILFSTGIDVIELHPDANMFPHYYFLSKALGHRYYYVCGRGHSEFSDFTVDTDQVVAQVDDVLAERPPKAGVS